MRRIAAVTFDLWDTLIQEYPGGSDKVAGLRIHRIGSLLESRGVVHTQKEIEFAYEDTGDFLQLAWSKKRDIPVHDQVLFMLSAIDDKLASKLSKQYLAEAERIYAESIFDNPPRVLPGAREALKALKEKSYRIGLISNTGRTPGSALRTVMEDMGVLEFFDATTFSNETLVRKPSEGAFRTTLDRLKVTPKAAVHVGDDAESDIIGAKKAGMHALHVVAPGQLASDSADGNVRSLSQVLESVERL